MGDAKKVVTAAATGGLSLVGDSFSTGASGAKRAAKAQAAQIAEQKKKEDLRLAEASSDVAKRKIAGSAGKRGRGSLIATSQTGLSTNLGGTQNG